MYACFVCLGLKVRNFEIREVCIALQSFRSDTMRESMIGFKDLPDLRAEVFTDVVAENDELVKKRMFCMRNEYLR